jgi:hypothetical protein
MKRDLELCTKILINLEKKGINEDISEIEGCPNDEFYYNARLLAEDACLIKIIDFGDVTDRYACVATRLTWAGHDFLEKAQSPEWIDGLKEHGAELGRDIASAGIKAALAKLGEVIAPYLRSIF